MTVSRNEESGPVDDCQQKWRERAGRWLSVEMKRAGRWMAVSRNDFPDCRCYQFPWLEPTNSVTSGTLCFRSTTLCHLTMPDIALPDVSPWTRLRVCKEMDVQLRSVCDYRQTDRSFCVHLHLRNYMASEHSKPQPEHIAKLYDCWFVSPSVMKIHNEDLH